jgi:Ion channel
MALFWAWGLIGYERSLMRDAALAFGLTGLYGVIYRTFPQILDCPESARTWFTPYYFSIVTYTTSGFGDVRPATLAGEIIVSSEVILGYTTLGLLLSVLAQNIARRSRVRHRSSFGLANRQASVVELSYGHGILGLLPANKGTIWSWPML